MSWAIGWDSSWGRDVGYGVPAWCDQPGCGAVIDRGLAYVCGGKPFGGDHGCGLYFCAEHLFLTGLLDPDTLCEACDSGQGPVQPTPDHPEWVRHKLTDESWAPWRAENPDQVAAMRGQS